YTLMGVGERLPFRDETFGAATCVLVLPHVTDPGSVVREVYRVLRRGGRAACVVFSASPLNLRLSIRRYAFGDCARTLPARLSTTQSLRRMLRAAGFSEPLFERSDFLPALSRWMPISLRIRMLRALDHLDQRFSSSPFAFLARKLVCVGLKA